MPSQLAILKKHTPLTSKMIRTIPKADIHVHVPGAIYPETAWELGIRNGLISVAKKDGKWEWSDGPNKIGKSDPVERYSNIFSGPGGSPVTLDDKGKPQHLEYNFHCLPGREDIFSGFDAVMATVHGHRHAPGGVQTPDDYRFIMSRIKDDCVEQNIQIIELLQNITIAHVLRPDLKERPEEARKVFFEMCVDIVKEFEDSGVSLRFQHCPNKTSKANVGGTMEERSMEWIQWLKEAEAAAPGIFIGINPAGHEGQEIKDGGPEGMRKASQMARRMGLKVEAHTGEAEGVEHMVNSIRVLEPDTVAHGVQVIELKAAIEETKALGIIVVMMPSINITLGTPIHVMQTSQGDVPAPKLDANGNRISKEIVKTKRITHITEHPFFPLLREHGLKIALSTDNPAMGGKSYTKQAEEMAGLGEKYTPNFVPMSAEEFVGCILNAVEAARCPKESKSRTVGDLKKWMNNYNVRVEHPLLELPKQAQAI